MGCAASVRHEDTVDAALRRVEQRQLDLCRVRAKSPRKHLEGHWAFLNVSEIIR